MASPAEQLIQRGREEGREEGLAEGTRKTLSRQLVLRFGALQPELQSRIATATSEQLERWADRFVTAETLDAVFAK